MIKQELSRGKIDVFITYVDHSDKSSSIVTTKTWHPNIWNISI